PRSRPLRRESVPACRASLWRTRGYLHKSRLIGKAPPGVSHQHLMSRFGTVALALILHRSGCRLAPVPIAYCGRVVGSSGLRLLPRVYSVKGNFIVMAILARQKVAAPRIIFLLVIRKGKSPLGEISSWLFPGVL